MKKDGQSKRIKSALFVLDLVLPESMDDSLERLRERSRSGPIRLAELGYPESFPFLLCLARTGMRLGEAIGLEWRDVDWTARVILVRRGDAATGSATRRTARRGGWT